LELKPLHTNGASQNRKVLNFKKKNCAKKATAPPEPTSNDVIYVDVV